MKNITKRKDGRWCGRKVVNGQLICVYGKTQLEAKNKLQAECKKTRPKQIESFHSFAIRWLKTYKTGNINEKTYKGYFNNINAHLNINTPINTITLEELQAYLNKLPASRIREEIYKLIRQIYKKAYELDLVKKDISQFLDKGKIQRGERRALNLDEQRKLVNALSDDTFSHRVITYLCTGARPAEFASIRQDELRPGWVKINGTKTKKSIRWVKISERLFNVLKTETKKFFIFDTKRFRQHLQKVAGSAGISYDIDIYCLRHTFATNLYILRVPEKDRQTYLGHVSGSSMTNDVYTTFSPDTKPQDIYDIYGDWYPEF